MCKLALSLKTLKVCGENWTLSLSSTSTEQPVRCSQRVLSQQRHLSLQHARCNTERHINGNGGSGSEGKKEGLACHNYSFGGSPSNQLGSSHMRVSPWLWGHATRLVQLPLLMLLSSNENNRGLDCVDPPRCPDICILASPTSSYPRLPPLQPGQEPCDCK